MKLLNCCKSCKNLNEDDIVKNKLKCTFCKEYNHEIMQILYNELKRDKGCSTCKYCEPAYNYPDYVTAERCICRVGLECDTVCFTVNNCPKWVGNLESEEEK